MAHIRHELIISAAAETIFNAITTSDGLCAWWTPHATAKPELESTARFGFQENYFKEMKIVKLNPFQQVEWNCVTGTDEWIGTTISFILDPGNKEMLLNAHPELGDQLQQQIAGDKMTALIFHHDNWKEYSPMFAECNYTWGRFLRSLKLFCETGKGAPWPNQHQN